MQREILFRGFRPCDGPDTIVVDGEKVKMACEHIIGILHCADDSILITLDDLKKEIADIKIDNRMCERDGMEWLKRPEWTLHDYTDGRKSTNLHRFMFCPECGEKIDWKAIRKEEVTP